MKKRYLVLHDADWHKNELPTVRSKKYATFIFQKHSFDKAPMTSTADGTKIADAYMMSLVDTSKHDLDGVIAVLDGNRLNGRNGVHVKKTLADGRKFSIMQVEARRGVYRVWKKKPDNTWFLDSTKRRGKESYKQIQYTFDHEIGHSLCWLNGVIDTLHTFVLNKAYELWWQVNKF